MEETKFTDTLAELEKAKCHKCNKLIFTSEEIQNAVESGIKSWFVKLRVSSGSKASDDVAPGQFLGSDTARFFRIQTTEAE